MAAAQVVVVEGGKVIVDERVGVNHLDGRAEICCAFGEAPGDHARGLHAEDGAEALAAREGAVAHGAMDGVRLGGRGGQQALQRGVGERSAGLEQRRNICGRESGHGGFHGSG